MGNISPSDEESLEGVCGGVLAGVGGVPERDLLLELVRHLLLLLALLAGESGKQDILN